MSKRIAATVLILIALTIVAFFIYAAFTILGVTMGLVIFVGSISLAALITWCAVTLME